jgi:hypothetical protein
LPRNWSWGKKRESGYRSKEEERVAEWLTEHEVKFSYETLKLEYEKPVRKGLCKKCGTTSCVQRLVYSPDFILENGTVIEYKGRFTAKDRTKLLAVKKLNPEVKLVLLFGADNKLDKRSTKRYSTWAMEHGFDFGIRVPPRRWLSERKSIPAAGAELA